MPGLVITLKDVGSMPVEAGTPLSEILGRPENKHASEIVAAKVNGDLVDLSHRIDRDAEVEFIPIHSAEGAEILRHSTSHIMAQAVQRLFPEAKVTIGPSIENGFYYDFDYDRPFTPEDFEAIEKEMAEIIGRDAPFVRREVSKEEAKELFAKMGENYKVEILDDIPDPTVSLYEHDSWVDLCRGPHLPSTGMVRAFKLLSVAGAYWRGDERNRMLQRLYGTAFPSRKDLDKHLHFLEEAKKRDHRRLGRELDLFLTSEEVGAGLPIYLPKGAMLRTVLEDFERREHLKRGYQIVIGPQLLKQEMWKRSGHWDNYRDLMYFTEIEGVSYGIKPMNCLSHMLIFRSKIRSYRDLPQRYFELGTVHRHEKSGVLHGLFRVRAFTQDDAHILCAPDQLVSEIQAVLDFVEDVMNLFGFGYNLEVSTRPAKAIGSDEDWDRATKALLAALDQKGKPYQIHEGEGAFYGPKIDVKLKDCLGRDWQCATIQCDFTLPERFDLYYIGPDGGKHRPVMIHRVILGSIERFIGVLIEHFAGAFPAWLAPVQAIVLPITDSQNPYAERVQGRLAEEGFRVETDLRNEKIGLKIREAARMKIPYMLVVGDEEERANAVAPRTREGKDLKLMPLERFVETFKKETRVAQGGDG